MRRLRPLPIALLLCACSDYGFSGEDLVGPGGDSAPPSDDSPGDADVDVDTDTDTAIPPPTFLDDCNPDTTASFDSGEIYVKSWDRETDSGTLSAAEAGWYHLYDLSLAESGASQTNEVSYLRIVNARRPDGAPYHANCTDEWIIDDFDNERTPEERIYAGTFWLEAGANALTLIHYCPLERRGYCPEFEDTSDPNSTCASDGPNSVHFTGSGLCLVRVDLPAP